MILMKKQSAPDSEWISYPCSVTEASSYDSSGKAISYYICKAEITLEPDTAYVYKAVDKYYCSETQSAVFTTGDPTAQSFRFAHVSDS